MPPSRQTPKLTPEILADNRGCLAQIDRLLRCDPQHQEHAKAILTARDELRSVVTHDGWELFEHVEVAFSTRLHDALLATVRWAFAGGPPHATPSGT